LEIEQWGESPFDEPVKALAASDPARTARLAGGTWVPGPAGEGRVVVPVLWGEIAVWHPSAEIEAPAGLDSFTLKLLTLIYLGKTDGTEPSGEWIPYREVPDGRFYEPVFTRSVEEPLAAAFGTRDPAAFRAAAEALSGSPEEPGDASFSFTLFPLVKLCFLLWFSDDEFPARAVVLFDGACPRHLNAFELRMGAQELASRLIRHAV